jgi:hypothetical protein
LAVHESHTDFTETKRELLNIACKYLPRPDSASESLGSPWGASGAPQGTRRVRITAEKGGITH